jgi:signal transduction histidine kinase
MKKNQPPATSKKKPGGNPPLKTQILIGLGIVATGSLVAIFHFSSELKETLDFNSNRVELTSRQRANSQRITKSLFEYERDLNANLSPADSLREMKEASEAFNDVLKSYDSGAKMEALSGVIMDFPKSTDAEELKLAATAKEHWLPLYELVRRVSTGKASKAELASAVTMAGDISKPLYDAMNGLTIRSNEVGQKEARSIGGWRNFFIGLASVSLFLIPSVFLIDRGSKQRKLAEEALASLEATYGELSSMGFAKAEMDRIMETVQEGLLLINQDGVIGQYHSKEAPLILRQEHLAGANLFSILKQHLSEKMFNTSKDFFDLLFNASRKEKTVLSVNPLTDIEVNFPNPSGGFITRYLGFSFRRILVDGKVDRLFVAMRDVTQQVELENQLREAEKTKEREMQILLSIVHVSSADVDAFINLADSELSSINQAMRAEDFAASGGKLAVLRKQLESVFRSVHNLNGNAGLLKLTYFQKAAHTFESKVKDLLGRASLSGDDFLAIVIAQSELRDDLNDLRNLRAKLGDLAHFAPKAAKESQATPTSALSGQLRQLVTSTAAELGKSAVLEIDEYALHAFSVGRTDLIRDVLVQLIRNAVAHGVEPADVRVAAGKPPTASLSIHALSSPAPGIYGLAVRDDGGGLDMELIYERGVEAGLLSSEKLATKAEIIQCIFEPGFSTTETADLHSGRGVGMDIVKSKFMDEAHGRIEVVSEPTKHCEFRLYLPS